MILPHEKAHPCYYCGLRHRKVEASGVYHCPNPLCQGPGAASFREKLHSYTEGEDGRHTVDPAEAVAFGLAYAATLTEDPELADHIRRSVKRWLRDEVKVI